MNKGLLCLLVSYDVRGEVTE